MKKTLGEQTKFVPGRLPRKGDLIKPEDIKKMKQRVEDGSATPEEIARLVMFTATHGNPTETA